MNLVDMLKEVAEKREKLALGFVKEGMSEKDAYKKATKTMLGFEYSNVEDEHLRAKKELISMFISWSPETLAERMMSVQETVRDESLPKEARSAMAGIMFVMNDIGAFLYGKSPEIVDVEVDGDEEGHQRSIRPINMQNRPKKQYC